MKIRKNDNVLIISGKDKGKHGKVTRALPREGKIVVEGINIVKKHRRARRQGEKGEIIEVVSPLWVSNVKLLCPKCGKATRIGFQLEENKKIRICKKCKQPL